jgi:hypothetical protein
MKTYRIVKEGAAWWVLSPTSGDPIVSSYELEEMVDWVRTLARRNGGTIELYDADGNVAMRESHPPTVSSRKS